MPRPMKWRRIEQIPEVTKFIPKDKIIEEDDYVQLKVEELEAMRLKDIEGLNQSACAERMNISRQTFQLIIDEARRKVAIALTQGYGIDIRGGYYTLNVCDYKCSTCGHEFQKNFEELGTRCPKCKEDNLSCSEDEKFCLKHCSKPCCKKQKR